MGDLDVLMVADGERLCLGAVIAAILARKTFPEARFHFAIPSDRSFALELPDGLLDRLGVRLLSFAFRSLEVEGNSYRILNKVRAMASFGRRPVLLCDSDVLFVRSIPPRYFTHRRVPAAVPEHGRHQFPWARLYPHLDLEIPDLLVLCGSGEISAPWFNAGVVYAPDGERLGRAWEDLCVTLNGLDWLPERWPYLDQIALPLAMARVSPQQRLGGDGVLDSRLNQNLFTWMPDQQYVRHGFVAHHHGRVSLIRRYLSDLIAWSREDYPVLDDLLDRYAAHEPVES